MTAFLLEPWDGTLLAGGKDSQTWKPLRFYNLYRLTLAGLFVTLFFSGSTIKMLGETSPELFGTTSVAYLLLVLLSGFTEMWRRPAFSVQVKINVLVDIFLITLLMHASGGVASGLGMLLLVSIAGGSLLTSGRFVLVSAAVASLCVLTEQLAAALHGSFDGTSYTQAGILGATFFAAALLAHVLANRIRASEALAAQRGVDLANMEQLNEYIIQHMQSGIVVVDPAGQVRLMNESARYLLGLAPGQSTGLAAAAPELARQWRTWRKGGDFEARAIRSDGVGSEIVPRFARLGHGSSAGSIVFLEDSAVTAQQAQQMKLASLGRLAASIAHEIRNPLGAIGHAGQLLSEAPALSPADRRLTEIIRDQTRRVNTIVENVLQLSRRERSRPEVLSLRQWLDNFLEEFVRTRGIDSDRINCDIQPPDTTVHIDPTHLQQILDNLCENGLRYGRHDGQVGLELRGGITLESRGPFLDVIDHGPGIPLDVARQIFEPFFTTDQGGTGLGLYIARELCEFNQAQLSYVPVPSGGSCFRIVFADPRRQVL